MNKFQELQRQSNDRVDRANDKYQYIHELEAMLQLFVLETGIGGPTPELVTRAKGLLNDWRQARGYTPLYDLEESKL